MPSVWHRILARGEGMKGNVNVTIRFDWIVLVIGTEPGEFTPDQAKRLAQLLELAANAVEKAEEMGENDEL